MAEEENEFKKSEDEMKSKLAKGGLPQEDETASEEKSSEEEPGEVVAGKEAATEVEALVDFGVAGTHRRVCFSQVGERVSGDEHQFTEEEKEPHEHEEGEHEVRDPEGGSELSLGVRGRTA